MFSPSSIDQQLAATWAAARTDRPRGGDRRRPASRRARLTRLVRPAR